MSNFDWITPMRANLNGTDEDKAARKVDHLDGQAALKFLPDGRAQLLVMPDLGTFSSCVTISLDDVRELLRVLDDRIGHLR